MRIGLLHVPPPRFSCLLDNAGTPLAAAYMLPAHNGYWIRKRTNNGWTCMAVRARVGTAQRSAYPMIPDPDLALSSGDEAVLGAVTRGMIAESGNWGVRTMEDHEGASSEDEERAARRRNGAGGRWEERGVTVRFF